MTKASRLWLLFPALLALAWFWPTLWHGFRSDDFLGVYYLDRETGAVRWGRVLEEWVRPWFGVRDLYRPVVSLSLGANWAVSTSPLWFHLTNVMLLAGTAVAVAATARRLARGDGRLVAVAAGVIVVLHPAAVESASWIMARTTGLQVFFSAVAYWSFVRWRDGDGRIWLPLLATLLACGSKEGAVLLPVSLLVLDLLRGRAMALRSHLPFWFVVGGYLVFRRLLLGWFTTAEEGHALTGRLTGAVELFGQLIAPPGGGQWFVGVLFVGAFLLVGGVLLASRSLRPFWCAAWALALLLPGTTHVALQDGELAGRFVFDAVPALALFVALALDRPRTGRWDRARIGLGLAVIAVSFAFGSRALVARYGDDDAVIAAAQRQLLAQADEAGPGKPFGVLGLPSLPLLQPTLWGFLAQRPFAPRDLPVVGLSNILRRDPAAASVFTDTTPIHALVADGAGCSVWDGGDRLLQPVAKADPGIVPFVAVADDPGRFVPVRLMAPTSVAALEIVSPVAVREWRAAILGNLDGEFAQPPFRLQVGGDGSTRWWIDTTGVLPWLVAAQFGGGPGGIELTFDGAAPPSGTQVLAHAALERYPLQPSDAGSIDREAFATVLGRPDSGRGYRLYVLLPAGVFAMEVRAGIEVKIAPEIVDQLGFVCDLLGPCRVHWFWSDLAAPPGECPARTAFGTCIVR